MIVLFITLLALALEGWIETLIGDKRHWPSVVITLGVALFASYLLEGTLHGYLATLFGYIAIRCWFDIYFNLISGRKWDYLGDNFTDRLLKRVPPVLLFFGRFVVSASFATASISELQQHYYMFYSESLVDGFITVSVFMVILFAGAVVWKRTIKEIPELKKKK